MNFSFSGAQAAAPVSKDVSIRASDWDMLSVRPAAPRAASRSRRDFIAQTNQDSEPEIVGQDYPPAPRHVEKTEVVREEAKPLPKADPELSSRLTTRTRLSRKSSGRTGLTIVPELGFSSSGVNYVGSQGERGYALTGGALLEFGRKQMTYETGVEIFQETFSAKSSTGDGVTQIDTSYKNGSLTFIGVPLAARMNFGQSGSTRYHVKAGAMPVYLVGSYWDYDSVLTDDFGSWEETGSTSDGEGLHKFNIYALLGGGFDWTFGNGKDLRFDTIYRRTILPLSSKSDTSADAFLVSLGLGFDL
jgi:hypothetical protein